MNRDQRIDALLAEFAGSFFAVSISAREVSAYSKPGESRDNGLGLRHSFRHSDFVIRHFLVLVL